MESSGNHSAHQIGFGELFDDAIHLILSYLEFSDVLLLSSLVVKDPSRHNMCRVANSTSIWRELYLSRIAVYKQWIQLYGHLCDDEDRSDKKRRSKKQKSKDPLQNLLLFIKMVIQEIPESITDYCAELRSLVESEVSLLTVLTPKTIVPPGLQNSDMVRISLMLLGPKSSGKTGTYKSYCYNDENYGLQEESFCTANIMVDGKICFVTIYESDDRMLQSGEATLSAQTVLLILDCQSPSLAEQVHPWLIRCMRNFPLCTIIIGLSKEDAISAQEAEDKRNIVQAEVSKHIYFENRVVKVITYSSRTQQSLKELFDTGYRAVLEPLFYPSKPDKKCTIV